VVVGALKLTLHLPYSQGLKPKRKVVRAIADRVRARFNTAVSEVGSQDLWQRIELGMVVCGPEVGHVERQLEAIGRFVEQLMLAEIVDRRQQVMNLKEMPWLPAGY